MDQPFGKTGDLAGKKIPTAALLVEIARKFLQKSPGVGCVENCEAIEQRGEFLSEMPGDRSTPIVTHNVGFLVAEGFDETPDIGAEGIEIVAAGGFVGIVVPS